MSTAARQRRRWLLAAELLVVAAVAAVILVIVLPGGHGAQHAPAPSGHSGAPSASSSASSQRSASTPTQPRPYAPNSVWNEPVPANVPLSPQSATYVSELQQQIKSHGEWINSTSYSIPVYRIFSLPADAYCIP